MGVTGVTGHCFLEDLEKENYKLRSLNSQLNNE